MTIESNDQNRQNADDHSADAQTPRPQEGADGAAGEPQDADTEAAPRPHERIAELESQAADMRDKWMRASADLENQRRRSRKEVAEARAEGTKRALAEVLPVVDNLERALQHAGTSTSDEAKAITEGVTLVMRQFSQALERLNVQEIDAEGKPFDPAVHEAMSQVETSELPPGGVAHVLQRGYRLGDRLLRPALVVVAKAPTAADQAAGPNGKSPDED